MKVEIITPDREIYKGEAYLIQLPGIDGSFEILNNHAPLISALKEGRIKLKKSKESKDEFYEVKGGVIEVLNNKVIILAE
ncbi:MAG: ATP synthase F1 subunit epsilon [Chlorobi bacterium]|nr:ATP synthase F1 subunit epsilon [Chlorobiota bacterium]